MKYSLLILVLIFSMCKNNSSSREEFDGRFKGVSDGITATANLTASKDRLRGTIILNGQSADVRGSIDGMDTRGILDDAATGKQYDYDGSIDGDELLISITFPEMNNRVVKLVLQRESGSRPGEKQHKNSGELDQDIIGTWKHTEILGGGNGSESMTNEYLMEFRDDGTCSSWQGISSGPGYFKEEDKANASNGKWYTKGKLLYFVDPVTGEDASTNYSVNSNGLLMSNGGANKKVWQRVQ